MALVFFSDLDRTLIYSPRHPLPPDAVPVEEVDGQVISYMAQATLMQLQQILQHPEIVFVPLTTRTPAQFCRIQLWQKLLRPTYALVSNGAELLVDQATDPAWMAESLALMAEQAEAFQQGYAAMAQYFSPEHLHLVAPFFAYGVSQDAAACGAALAQEVDLAQVVVAVNGRKVYCLPKALEKGTAVRRFSRRFPTAHTVGIGDSVLDISMLAACDDAFGAPDILSAIPGCRPLPAYGQFDITILSGLYHKGDTP